MYLPNASAKYHLTILTVFEILIYSQHKKYSNIKYVYGCHSDYFPNNSKKF